MTQQMSLFPLIDPSGERSGGSESDGNALDEVFAAVQRLRSSREYGQLLRFIGRFSNYSAFNGFLLYLQNPDAICVATAGIWKKRFRRTLKADARPLMILAPMSPVRFVFDLSDTEGDSVALIPPNPPDVDGDVGSDVFDNTVHNCALHRILVSQVETGAPSQGRAIELSDDVRQKYPELEADAGVKYLILLYREHRRQDKYAAMVHELGHILCGHRGVDRNAWWPDRRKTDPETADLEAASVAFLVCCRMGLIGNAQKHLTRYEERDQVLPVPGLNLILQATNYIEEMARTRWQKPKKSR